MYYISHGGPGSGRYPLGSGERPYQKYEGGGIIKKGTKLGRISAVNVNGGKTWKDKKAYMYDANNPHDSLVYEGAFSKYLKMFSKDAGKDIYKYAYETTKDLKIATDQEQRKEIVDMFNENVEDLKYVLDVASEYFYDDLYSERFFEKAIDFDSADWDKDYSKLSLDINDKHTVDLVMKTFDKVIQVEDDISKEYFDRMAKKYDAIIDSNNVDIYNEAENPLIIFNPDKNLKYINKEKLDWGIIYDNYDELEKKMKEKGKEVLL